MKKILIAVILALNTLCLSAAQAETCTDKLGILFTPQQRGKLCTSFPFGPPTSTVSRIVMGTSGMAFRNSTNTTDELTISAAGVLTAAGAATLNGDLTFGGGSSAAAKLIPNGTGGITFRNAANDTDIFTISNAGIFISNGAGTVNGDLTFGTAGQQPKYPLPAVMTPSTTFPTPNAGDTLVGVLSVVATAAPTAAYVELAVATASQGKQFAVYNKSANPLQVVAQGADVINALVANTPFACATGKLCNCRSLTAGSYVCVAQ